MNTHIRNFAILAALFSSQCLAADESNAQELYDQNCVSCHGPEVYTRENHKITSVEQLEKQVRQCETNLELRWFDDDIAAVTQLLNNRYYHFKP